MKNNNLAEEIFQTLMLIPTKSVITQAQVVIIRNASEQYAKLPDAENFLKNMKVLMEDSEGILERAQLVGDQKIYDQIKVGVDRLQKMQDTEQ